VELLVVIGIIGLLAAIITPVVMQSLTKARNAAIKAEIDMLHMAIMNYKNEYGSFPPCVDLITTTGTGVAGRHLQRVFPRCQNPAAQFTNVFSGKVPTYVYPTNAIAFWLSGFTENPSSPLDPNSARKKLYDFDSSRLDMTTGRIWPSGKSSSPYVYIDKSQYGAVGIGGSVLSFPVVTTSGSTDYFAHRLPPAGTTVWNSATQQPFNADTFQILCAGRDEQFGTDDDLSNFWPGTRREYLDSLKD
jgi:type II secretory pathway pseudopilin PulG